jgi:hypothetical protein
VLFPKFQDDTKVGFRVLQLRLLSGTVVYIETATRCHEELIKCGKWWKGQAQIRKRPKYHQGRGIVIMADMHYREESL